LKALNRILDGINKFLATIAGIWLGFLLLSISYAVFSRFVFNEPHSNLIEISAYGLVYIAFLSAPWLLQERKHIIVDIIVNLLSKRKQIRLSIFTDIVGFLISVVIFYISLLTTINNYVQKIAVMDSLQTPQFLLLMSIPIGTFFLAIQFIRNLKKDIDNLKVEKEGEC